MYETGKQASSHKRNESIQTPPVISECRWTGCGNRITSTGETIIYSGRNDE
jgi:hypothetical protein